MSHRQALGAFGETYAAYFLQRQGYRIIARNVRYRVGEIDIVAYHGADLVFIEVKTRQSTDFGLPEDALTPTRLSHLDAAIDAYLDTLEGSPPTYRVEVVAIEIDRTGRVTRCEIIPDLGLR
jgi:putative endonuclease